MKPTIITAKTLPDAWFQLVYTLLTQESGVHHYIIDKGSYVGQKRYEFDYVLIQVEYPGARPLIPDIPPGLNIPPPVESMEYVDGYFARYLMDPELEANETYKYATWLAPGVERVIEQLKGAPGNNQAAISVGGWAPLLLDHPIPVKKDISESAAIRDGSFVDTDNFVDPGTGQRDPACLRLVDFRLDQQNKLHMIVYFRSWDLWGGLPANLAGLQLLKEYVAQEIGAEDGTMIASSKGLHLYDHAIQVAAQRIGMSTVGTLSDLLAFMKESSNE